MFPCAQIAEIMFNLTTIVFFLGETYKSLSYLFRVANNTIGKIVPETCWALYDVLREDYFQVSGTYELIDL